MSKVFLRASLVSTLMLICFMVFGCSTAETHAVVLPKEQRPNIVFILVDDLDLKLNTIDYMQNLQELMIDRGTTLDDFLITDAVCCPSRTTILRGQYTHSHQVYHNTAPDGGFYKFNEVGNNDSTLGVWLQAAGYRTALMGKYLNGYPYPTDRTFVPPGWSEWLSTAKKNAYDGYDYVLNENGTLVEYPPVVDNYFTDVMSRKAVDFIQRASAEDVPFFLYLAPFAPHTPSTPAARHLELFPTITIPITPSFNEADVSDKPPGMSLNPLLTDEIILQLNVNYRDRVRSMQAVDEMIAELIKTLEQHGQLENTYIVFTSDNGFHMGQHRLYEGKNTAYEEDIIVPFIVRGPGIPEDHVVPGFLAGNVDIASTISDWAGVVPPTFVEGRSFAGVLAGGDVPADWRQAYLLEIYSTEGEAVWSEPDEPSTAATFKIFGSQLSLPKIGTQSIPVVLHGLRMNDYVYVEYGDGFVELYDLIKDPYELDNIAASADPSLLKRFSDWLQALSVCSRKECLELDTGARK